MRIGLFIDVFYPMIDGVVKVVDEYARRLSKEHKVFVICPKANDSNYIDNFPYEVIRVVKIKVLNTDYDIAIPPLDAKLQKTLKTLDLDIVHFHSPFSIGELAIQYAKKYKVPCVATLHSQYKKDFYDRTKSSFITQVMLNDIMKRVDKADLVLTMNEGSKGLYKGYGLTKTPLIIPNATDMTYRMGDLEEENLIQQYHIDIKKFNMIFVGRIDKIKNLEFLLNAIKVLVSYTKDIHLYCIGQGAHMEYFKTLSKKLEIDTYISFIGPVYDRKILSAWYHLSDLLVFPSTYDTNGLVQYEAASQKTPGLLLAHTLAASEIIPDVNGYICEENTELYAKAILDLIKNPDKHIKISEESYKSLYHHWSQVMEEVERTYERLIYG
jgi:glycosyltransferase involved in cell wall biosynthesis